MSLISLSPSLHKPDFSHSSEKVAEQAEDVSAVFEVTEEVEADVDAGLEQLIDASKRRRVARHIYVTITLVLSFILLFMDFVFD